MPTETARATASLTVDPRVLHVVTGMGFGGTERVVTQLSTARGADAAVAWLKGPNAWESALASTGVQGSNLCMESLRLLPKAVSQLSRLIREFRADVVHTHLVYGNLVGRWAARKAGGVRVVTTEHGLRVYPSGLYKWLSRLDARSSRGNAATIAISEAVRARCLLHGYRPDTIRVIYNGVELPVTEAPPAGSRLPNVLMVGRVNFSEKGNDLFVEAVKGMNGVRARLVGDGPDSGRLEEMIRGLPPGTFRWDRRTDALEAVADAAVAVLTSRQEGLGIFALEAMAYARPVVSVAVGGLPEVVEDGKTGYLVTPDSPPAVAEAVNRLLSDPNRCNAMGAAGRKRVEERFLLSTMLAAYDDLYAEVAAT